MSFKVIIPEGVYEELNRVALYYEEQQKDLGVKFLNDWEDTMSQISRSPLIYQKKFKQFRCVQFNRFSFLLVFELDKKEIVIYRLIHVRINPTKRFRRWLISDLPEQT